MSRLSREIPLYPLRFRPRLLPKMWGGRKMERVLGKALPPGHQIGESWEIYDFPPGVIEGSDQWVSATVAEGPLAGRTLHELIDQYGADLMGDVPLVAAAGQTAGQFPVLIKFLDAREDLSIQVHPDEAYAAAHAGARVKTEAWYVVQAEPGARILKGLRAGTSRAAFANAIEAGTVEALVNSVGAKPGDCHYLPSGTVHALGAGVLVAEVQTPSDTTFRIHDFGRIDPATGRPRELHIQQALECIDFTRRATPRQARSHVAGLFTTVTRLITSPSFTIEKVRFTEGVEEPVPYDEPVVWIMLEGTAEIRVGPASAPVRLEAGRTVLLPARMDQPILKTTSDCIWLEVTFARRGAA